MRSWQRRDIAGEPSQRGSCADDAPTPGPTTAYVAIAQDVFMPRIGLGTWRLLGAPLRDVMASAFSTGYRLVDTAPYYDNEADVGTAVRRSGVPRESLFITTKIRGADQGRMRTRRGLEQSLKDLKIDYADLVLIHWPLPMRDQYLATWIELIALREQGMARAIGVSNFNPAHIDRLVKSTGVLPAVNQIQRNPAVSNSMMNSHNLDRGVHTQAWEPLGPRSGVLTRRAVRTSAERLGRTPAQVVLRWHIQSGGSAVPKTATAARLSENLDVFDWELPAEVVREFDGLDEGGAGRVDPDTRVVL